MSIGKDIKLSKIGHNKSENDNNQEIKNFDLMNYNSADNTCKNVLNNSNLQISSKENVYRNNSNQINYNNEMRIINLQEKNISKSFSLTYPFRKFHTENKKDGKFLFLNLNKDKLKIEATNIHLDTVAEIKDDIYSIVKIVRMFSLYFVVPYNILLILSHFDTTTLDALISQSFCTIALVFIPYLFTENFVINMKYDKNKDQMHITKMNFFCKLVTKIYDVRNLVKIHRKYNLRFFSYFRDIKTNEYFSIIKICNIKNIHLMNQILPDKVLKGKRKEDINQRLIDMKLNKSEYILSFVKLYLFAYLLFTAGYIYYQAKNYNKKNEIELP